MPESNTPPTEVAGREAPTVELPPLPEWSKRDDLGGLVPSEVRQALSKYALDAIRSYAERMAGYRGAAEQAFAIADESMFDLLTTECVESGDKLRLWHTNDLHYALSLSDTSEAVHEAFGWLQPRGYVELATDGDGEFIRVLKRPAPPPGAAKGAKADQPNAAPATKE